MIAIFLLALTALALWNKWPARVWVPLLWATWAILAYTLPDRLPAYAPYTWMSGVLVGLVLTSALTLLAWGPFRRRYVTMPLASRLRQHLPKLSATEKMALESGSVGWEGHLLSGQVHPTDWQRFFATPSVGLTPDEAHFLHQIVDEVCALCDEHVIAQSKDLPPEVWQKLKEHKFFGMIIPKDQGGLGFSAMAHHKVIEKLSSKSIALGVTVGVPNSLGPAELLMHYGTQAQKDMYLPRLARGQDIPCFALTGPWAGSDAAAMPDRGVVCKEVFEGEELLGVKITCDKRYITLAPVATLVGLAFRMEDPDGLLNHPQGRDVGLSLALVPRTHPGLIIGDRHDPLGAAFFNGTVRSQDMFVPLSMLIGGASMAGQGWKMLMECLSIGRSITLPSLSSGGARAVTLATASYARLRRQFGLPIGLFEGVKEALAVMASQSISAQALAWATASAVSQGAKPAVPSAMAKWSCTEWARTVTQHAMDVHGGKGIIMGPHNYLGRRWQQSPIGITVEGANIMTRSLLVFGQGAILCHPFVPQYLRLFEQLPAFSSESAPSSTLPDRFVEEFDAVLMKHFTHTSSNALRALALGWGNITVAVEDKASVLRHLTHLSLLMSVITDILLSTYGGRLKSKEFLSGRMADVLTTLYTISFLWKKHQDDDLPEQEKIVLWASQRWLHDAHQALDEIMDNLGWKGQLLHLLMPNSIPKPSDEHTSMVAGLIMTSPHIRAHWGKDLFLQSLPNHPLGRMVHHGETALRVEGLIKRLEIVPQPDLIRATLMREDLTQEERSLLHQYMQALEDGVAVDVMST